MASHKQARGLNGSWIGLAMAIAALMSQPADAAGVSPKDLKTLRIGIDRSHVPFIWIDPEQGPQGFDVEIAKALCARLQASCTFVADTRDALIGNLLARRTDAVVASLPITDDARKTVEFTDRYEALAARFVVPRGSGLADPSPETLKGKTVGVLTNSRFAHYLEAVYGPHGVTIKAVPSSDALHSELQAGRIDAILGDAAELYRWFDAGTGGRCCRFTGDAIRGNKWLGDGGGIAVRREDVALRDALNRALGDILRDGSYEKLNAAYFPFLLY
jgi:polar amino acid transport system substrate-binding protein